MSEAESWIEKTIETDKANNFIFFLGQDHIVYAEFFRRKGNLPKAKENLNRAIENFRDCSADGWVKKYEKELAVFS